MPISRILVALDLAPHGRALTPGSALALDQALAVAPALGASVLLLHSTIDDEVWDPEAHAYIPRFAEEHAQHVSALDATLARAREAGLDAELTLTVEPADFAVIRRVLRGEADLVIAGKRNHAVGIGRPGSVSGKLLRVCPGPVWVVKPGGALRPRCVLAASDLTRVGERVLGLAAFVADRCGAALHLVHAFQRPLAVQHAVGGAAFEREQRETCERSLREQLARATSTSPTATEAELHVGLTSPTQAILSCRERLAADLVVMGTVSRGGVPGLLLGNTAERLLERLDVSLLTVKPEDFVCPVAPDG